MKKFLAIISCIAALCSCSTTRYYIVRHAEKTSNDCPAPLAQPLVSQSCHLRDSLLAKHIDSIFVSTCLRTQQTAQPLATALNLSMIQFDPGAAQTQNLIARLKKIRGKNMLVVGHTSTVPDIVLR
jgi:phosphohistidine phosphatase SixA